MLALAAGGLLLPLRFGGLWDPYELRVADFARRIAIDWLGASGFQLDGSPSDIPTLEEVGQGEFPLLLIATSFRAFGLSSFAGRLPMALAGLIALLVQYWGTRRLAGNKEALLVPVVMLTMPAFFVQARSILGDAVMIAAVAGAFYTLACWTYEVGRRRGHQLGCLTASVACVVIGVWSRGLLVGAAVPLLAVGIPGLLLFRDVRRWRALALTIVGCCVAAWGVGVLFLATPDRFDHLVGTLVTSPRKFWTHDHWVQLLGHGCFPWSVLLPISVGLALSESSAASEELRRARALRLALATALALAIGAQTLIAQRAELQPFSPLFAISGLCAAAIMEWDRRKEGSPAAAMVAAALLVLLLTDFRNFPDKALSAFFIEAKSFPEDAELPSRVFLTIPTLACVLVLTLLATEAVPLVQSWLGRRPRWLNVPRRWLVGGAFGAIGVLLSAGLYPALARQLSPVSVFEAYRGMAAEGEPIATVGKRGSVARYYGASHAFHFRAVREGVDWLLADEKQRRWLAVNAEDLGRVNAWYREAHSKNVPILDSASSEVVLVSNQLRPGERSKNRFDEWVLDARPTPAHPLDAEFGSALKLLGWEVRRKDDGRVTEEVVTGEPYRLRLFYEVVGKVSRQWKTFVHIDGQGTRFNGDHDTLDDEYRMKLWNEGDFIVDDYVFELEPSFGAGKYSVNFGFFSGSQRYEVTRGEHKDDRITAGDITVVER